MLGQYTSSTFTHHAHTKPSPFPRSVRQSLALCRRAVFRLGLVHPSLALTLTNGATGEQLLHLPRGRPAAQARRSPY